MSQKDDEKIYVIDEKYLPLLSSLHGIITMDDDYRNSLYRTFSKHAYWKRRGDVEENPKIKQIIPYTVVMYNNDVLIYKRLSGSGEQRLVNLYSLGFGGHIAYQSFYDQLDKSWRGLINRDIITDEIANNIIIDSIIRELNEELGLMLDHYRGPYVRGLLYAGESMKMVDRVHMGLVNFVFVSGDLFHSQEQDIIDLKSMINVFSLKRSKRHYTYETWSELVIHWLTTDRSIRQFLRDILE